MNMTDHDNFVTTGCLACSWCTATWQRYLQAYPVP